MDECWMFLFIWGIKQVVVKIQNIHYDYFIGLQCKAASGKHSCSHPYYL